MNNRMHALLAEAAVDWLAGEAAAVWQPVRETISVASNYPDYFATGADSLPKHRHAEPDWERFTLIPDNGGSAIAHSVFKPDRIRETYPAIIRHWVSCLLDGLKKGDPSSAAKFAGCLSHLIGDTGQAAHLVDERILSQMVPLRDTCFVIHSVIERQDGRIESTQYSPRNLGTTEEMFVWRLEQELLMLKRQETAEVAPILTAILDGRKDDARASASRTLEHCAKLFADCLLSLASIAAGAHPKHGLELDVRTLVPLAVKCDMLFNYGIMIDRMPGSDVNHPLDLDPGLGRSAPGICLLADMAPNCSKTRDAFVDYALPRDVFHSFRALAGLNHLADNETGAVFQVLGDNRVLFDSGAQSPDARPVVINVPITGVSTLRLYACDVRPPPCSTKFFYPVFAHPVLVRG